MSCSSNKPRKSRKPSQSPLFINTPTGPIAAVATAPEPAPAPVANANAAANASKPANLKLEEARQAILAALKGGAKDRSALKALVPFGNYTLLMRGLETDGLVKGAKAGSKWSYTITAKGRKA